MKQGDRVAIINHAIVPAQWHRGVIDEIAPNSCWVKVDNKYGMLDRVYLKPDKLMLERDYIPLYSTVQESRAWRPKPVAVHDEIVFDPESFDLDKWNKTF